MKVGQVLVMALLGIAFVAESAQGQGKEVSVLYATPSVTLPVCSSLTFATVASVPTPLKYKSKKNYLLITTAIEGYCNTGQIFAQVTVAGNIVPPTAYRLVCDSTFSQTATTSLWNLVPESEGGPVIPDGSTVDVGLCTNAGGGVFQSAQVRVEIAK